MQRLLTLLEARQDTFEERLSAIPVKVAEDFRFIELRQFLNQAVALKVPIECSL